VSTITDPLPLDNKIGSRTKHSTALVSKTKAWKDDASREANHTEPNIAALRDSELETMAAGTQ
jgi:hypothetical protein